MGREISQFDIPNRKLLASGVQPRTDVWTDIGEAKVIHTIFGRAKIRVIREKDKNRRALLLGVLVVTVLATGALEGWIALQEIQRAPPPLPLSERVWVGPPVFSSAYVPPQATPPSMGSKLNRPSQPQSNGTATNRKDVPQQSSRSKTGEQKAAKTVTPEPSLESRTHAATHAASKRSTNKQADMQMHDKPSAAPPPIAGVGASNPAVVVPPLLNEESSTPSTTANNPPPERLNAPP